SADTDNGVLQHPPHPFRVTHPCLYNGSGHVFGQAGRELQAFQRLLAYAREKRVRPLVCRLSQHFLHSTDADLTGESQDRTVEGAWGSQGATDRIRDARIGSVAGEGPPLDSLIGPEDEG